MTIQTLRVIMAIDTGGMAALSAHGKIIE